MVSTICYSQNFEAGETYFHENDYVEYLHGNLPIIISIPHGGEKTPNNIPDRSCDTCVIVNDAFTQELGRLIIENIYHQTGCYPHVIINRLHRKKLDANREINEAAQGNLEAENAWEFYQSSIENSKTFVNSAYSKGLFIDLHGHAHTNQRLELGYLISKGNLMLSDEDLDANNYAENSSIKNLAENNLNELNFSELLRGQSSFGSQVSNFGYPSVPSHDDQTPLESEAYFSGGYNTMIHGSSLGGVIDAIQVECNQDVRFDESAREEFAEVLTEAIILFLETHYFENITDGECGIVNTKETINSNYKIYPNPFSKFFEIENLNTLDEITIFNSLGKPIYGSKKISKHEKIDFSNYPNGIYLIIVNKNHEQFFSQKLIKTN